MPFSGRSWAQRQPAGDSFEGANCLLQGAGRAVRATATPTEAEPAAAKFADQLAAEVIEDEKK